MITLRGMEKLIVTTHRMPRVDFPVRKLRIRSGETLLDNYDNLGITVLGISGPVVCYTVYTIHVRVRSILICFLIPRNCTLVLLFGR